MATKLQRPVCRVSNETVFERGKDRAVMLILTPPNLVGFRLKGMRKTFYLPAAAGFFAAMKAEIAAEKRAKDKEKNKGRKRQIQRGVL